ncbi:hypothetical protein B0O99DRAFT_643304 [Bisporella sp. PMI_857]|nr:hypothetical protein B0O99DRAFT_643304 [Bisporella sp. PMI_857]
MNRAGASRLVPVNSTNTIERSDGGSGNGRLGEGAIRPRNRRLISTAGEQELVSTSATSTPSGSRAVSPIPSKYPSRSTSKGVSGNGVGGRLVVSEGPGRRGSPQPQGLGGIWEGGWMGSWTALQGIASSVLGIDDETNSGGPVGGSSKAKGKAKQSWGPEGLPKPTADILGKGTTAETEAKLRVRKMRGVLEGRDEDLNARKDTNGNYKRRTSSDEARTTPVEEDAMVYVHHVQPSDTLAGVILRYNCDPAIFRKANRLWPNDSIQIRKVVLLPVDACTIKGRPCDPPSSTSQGVDLLAPTPAYEDPPFNNDRSWPGSSSRIDASAERNLDEEDRPWTTVRWVIIDSSVSSKPVEIARMPRKTLGYFPPRRRKSLATISNVSTPRGSTDFSTFSQSPPSRHNGTPPSRRASLLGPQSNQPVGSYFPSTAATTSTRPTRPRRESVTEAADRLGWMRGPGGVGTLTGKNVRKPGPSQDGLNAWARKHIPGLAIDSLPSASLPSSETAHFGFDGELSSISEGPLRNQGGTATPSGLNQGLGIENAAAAIEGWVRRLAIKAPGTPSGRRTAEPDLIELLDGAGSDDGRGFELTPGTVRTGTPVSGIKGKKSD